MKKYFSILFFLIGISIYSHAQDTLKHSIVFDPTARENSKINLDSVNRLYPDSVAIIYVAGDLAKEDTLKIDHMSTTVIYKNKSEIIIFHEIIYYFDFERNQKIYYSINGNSVNGQLFNDELNKKKITDIFLLDGETVFDPTARENSKINLDSIAKIYPEGITRSPVCCVTEFVYRKDSTILFFEDYDFGYKINGNEVSQEQYDAIRKKYNITLGTPPKNK